MKKFISLRLRSKIVFVFTFVILFIFNKGFAQFDVKKKNEMTLSLVNPTLSMSPRYNVGYYYHLKPNLKVGLTVGYGNKGISLITDNPDTFNNYQLWEFRPEVSYLYRLNKKTPHFISFEVFYIRHTDVFYNDRYYEEGYVIVFDQADYNRIKSGFNVNYGMQISLAPNFGMIPQVGLGLKNRVVSFDNFINKRIFPNEDNHGDVFGTSNYLEQGGKQITLNLNADVKVFYRF